MKHLVIFLPRDRQRNGAMHLFDERGATLLADLPCLGKADNARAAKAGNPSRDPTRPYGDTPSGSYVPSRAALFAEPHPRLGRGWIPLEGVSGAALMAHDQGRTGLGIHAGRGDARLVPTFGCVRLRDADFDRLVAALDGGEVAVRIEDLA